MAKTQAPSEIEAAGGKFRTDAVPDPFDERDLEYRARLQPLPPWLDCRPADRAVMKQKGSSCTGHALAAVINSVYSAPWRDDPQMAGKPARVSPYMLYHLARRYDEFDGEEDIGSSLRGALKGWFYHGVVRETKWRSLKSHNAAMLDDEDFRRLAGEHPLGAFYRVNAFRLDDMQSAINELQGICCSAAVHSGWKEPQLLKHGDRKLNVILRPGRLDNLGGHAFAIVGYNEVGFLVQNSWGTEWGAKGFATLPYDDWLDSAYDAWVARPGVPKTPSYRGRTNAVTTTGEVGTAPGPDLVRLQKHVVNIGNNGRLSARGKFASTPEQVDQIFNHMKERHDQWRKERPTEPMRIVFYAHGGLNSESTGLKIAGQHRGWWLNNHVYPVYFAWQSGAVETMLNQLTDLAEGWLPFGVRGFDALEAFDALVERGARRIFRGTWNEMKENATMASSASKTSEFKWPPGPGDSNVMKEGPAGTLTIHRLARYIGDQTAPCEVHLAGHSAGSIFLAEFLQRLGAAKVPVASINFLAPALRVDQFKKKVLPSLGKTVERLAVMGLNKEAELDDVCGTANLDIYHKSLLYLVSRALEEGDAEVPLLGMEKFMDEPVGGGKTLQEAIEDNGGACIFAPSNADAPENSRSNARTHSGMDDDSPTMTSVMLRVLDAQTATEDMKYRSSTAEKTPMQPSGAVSVPAAPRVKKGEVLEEAQPAPANVESDGGVQDVTVAPAGKVQTPSPVELMLANLGWSRASKMEQNPAVKA